MSGYLVANKWLIGGYLVTIQLSFKSLEISPHRALISLNPHPRFQLFAKHRYKQASVNQICPGPAISI